MLPVRREVSQRRTTNDSVWGFDMSNLIIELTIWTRAPDSTAKPVSEASGGLDTNLW
jgi:hypothetical protein